MDYEKRIEKLEKQIATLKRMVRELFNILYDLQSNRRYVAKKDIEELQIEINKLKSNVKILNHVGHGARKNGNTKSRFKKLKRNT